MSRFQHRFAAARAEISVAWTDARASAIRARLDRRIVRDSRRRIATATLGAVLVLIASVRLWHVLDAGARSTVASVSLSPPARVLRLADGSTVISKASDSDVRVVSETPTETIVELARGAARFDITHRPERIFRVDAGGVRVQVLGTTFAMTRHDDVASVSVASGRVRVLWRDRYADLDAGEMGDFPRSAGALVTPLETDASAEAAPPPPASDRLPPAIVTRTTPVTTVRAWHALAEQGRYEEAYRALREDDLRGSRDTVGDLLLMSDVVRLSGHPAEAVAPLSRLLAEHPGDPRAPLVAFTLGRVLLDELGRPREAAAAFVRAHDLDPQGSMAADSLARAVEAYARAGDSERARTTATQYVGEHPDGTAVRRVRRLGGLE